MPNVLTSDRPLLKIKDLVNEAITEVAIRVFNVWGNQVYYVRRPQRSIDDGSNWFDASKVVPGTYWYELTIHYGQEKKYLIKDYIEVLK